MINQNLLNSVYCSLELKPFYEQKKDEIKKEYEETSNPILGQFLNIIETIIKKLDEFDYQFKSSHFVDIKSILPYFLTNQMNNNYKEKQDIDKLRQEKEQILKELKNYKRNDNNNLPDYVYDDFPSDNKRL